MAEIAAVTNKCIKAWSQRSTRLRQWAHNNLVVIDGEPTAQQLAAAQKATRPAKPESKSWAQPARPPTTASPPPDSTLLTANAAATRGMGSNSSSVKKPASQQRWPRLPGGLQLSSFDSWADAASRIRVSILRALRARSASRLRALPTHRLQAL